MNGSVVFTYKATSMANAVQTLTTKWRELCEAPEAELPWSTNLDITMEDGESSFDVIARVDFDHGKVEVAEHLTP